MSISQFFQLVELRTKLASMLPFALGSVFAIYRYKSFNLKNFLIMFVSLLAFDMATTAINNYIDNKKAKGNNANEMFIEAYGVNESKVLTIIIVLIVVATTAGIMLTLNTNLIVLFIGIISFAVGVLYTFGPIPISRMPLGELFSGFFMGFLIIFLSVYIHVYDKNIIFYTFHNGILNVGINILEVLCIFLYAIPSIGGIANIMLANNICDLEEDTKNGRFTLPYYIGRPMAFKLFKLLYYVGYADIVFLVVIKVLPIASIVILITLIKINENIGKFSTEPIKSKNFVKSVANFVLISISQLCIMGLVLIYNGIIM